MLWLPYILTFPLINSEWKDDVESYLQIFIIN